MTGTQRATFHSMIEGTQEDWARIAQAQMPHNQQLADRVLDHLRLLAGDYGGFAVDRLTHSLQTAARAEQDDRDEEYVVCGLLHDLGDTLGSYNHAEVAASILRPFVSPENHWIVAHHGIFQGYYFFHYLGGDRHVRDRFRDHPWFEACARFCADYDQNSFDPDFETPDLAHFEPMVRRVFAEPRTLIAETQGTAAAGNEPEAGAQKAAEVPATP